MGDNRSIWQFQPTFPTYNLNLQFQLTTVSLLNQSDCWICSTPLELVSPVTNHMEMLVKESLQLVGVVELVVIVSISLFIRHFS